MKASRAGTAHKTSVKGFTTDAASYIAGQPLVIDGGFTAN
jgi:hypothetical protein